MMKAKVNFSIFRTKIKGKSQTWLNWLEKLYDEGQGHFFNLVFNFTPICIKISVEDAHIKLTHGWWQLGHNLEDQRITFPMQLIDCWSNIWIERKSLMIFFDDWTITSWVSSWRFSIWLLSATNELKSKVQWKIYNWYTGNCWNYMCNSASTSWLYPRSDTVGHQDRFPKQEAGLEWEVKRWRYRWNTKNLQKILKNKEKTLRKERLFHESQLHLPLELTTLLFPFLAQRATNFPLRGFGTPIVLLYIFW